LVASHADVAISIAAVGRLDLEYRLIKHGIEQQKVSRELFTSLKALEWREMLASPSL